MFPRQAVVFVAALALCRLACAQQPPATQPALDLPRAEDILDGYIEATGGKAAWQKLRTRTATGSFEIPSLGAKGRITTWAQSPRKLAQIVELGDLGKTEKGCDGTYAWEVTRLGDAADLGVGGPRLLEGDEEAFMLREATFSADLRWRELTKSAEVIAEEQIDGEACYKLKVVTRDDREMILYYGKSTNLLVRLDTSATTQLGRVSVEVYPSDYRKVMGVLVPHRTTSKLMGMTQAATFDKIEFNKPIEAKRFAMPAEIKKLVEERKRAKPANPQPEKPRGKKP